MKALPNPAFKIIAVRTLQMSLAALVLQRCLHWPLTGPHALGVFLTPLLCLYFVFVFVAPWSWGLPILTRLTTRERVVALTFDDGPSPETTPLILDILRDASVPATFFVLGNAVERHPELLRRIVREGHAVGLHGFHHAPLVLAPAARLREEIRQAASVAERVSPSAEPLTLFRPPHGFKTLTMAWMLRRWGYQMVLWSLNPRDYHGQSPGDMAGAFWAALHPGAISLMHDNAASLRTVQALPEILDGLKRLDYRCVRLDERGSVEKAL